jgi:hypothetical protein
MKDFMTSGAHRIVMPKLFRWCDEAAVGHWEQEPAEQPDWNSAARYLVEHGRLSRVQHPSDLQKQGIVNGA